MQELARGAAIYASLANSMVASVIEELSPKDQRPKLLLEKLAIIQEAQVAAVSAGFAAASNLQLLWQDTLLKNLSFQPQVQSAVRTAPFEGSHILGPEPKVLQQRVRTIRLADRMVASRKPRRQPRPAQRRLPQPRRTSSPGLQCLSVWVLLRLRLFRGPLPKISPFVQVPAGQPGTDPSRTT